MQRDGKREDGCWLQGVSESADGLSKATEAVSGFALDNFLCDAGTAPLNVDVFQECCDRGNLVGCSVEWRSAEGASHPGNGTVFIATGFDARAFPALAKALSGSDPFNAHYAAKKLMEYGPRGAPLTAELRKAAASDHPFVRGTAAAALLKVSHPKASEIPLLLVQSIESMDASIAKESALGLSRYTSDAKRLVPRLTQMVREIPYNEEYALMGIEALGPSAKSAIPDLIDTLNSVDKYSWTKLRARLARTICFLSDPTRKKNQIYYKKERVECPPSPAV